MWSKFRDCVLAKLLLIKNLFSEAKADGDLDTIQWFSEFQCSRNKHSSKFFGLELLIAKIVGVVHAGDVLKVNYLIRKWSTSDKAKACAFSDLI
ncbi:hypothetical protein G9A89_022870 [Geosiphon pyriformis]|nr:hypothetical protein G9A89_022870 [Geosiphon pyriformis]